MLFWNDRWFFFWLWFTFVSRLSIFKISKDQQLLQFNHDHHYLHLKKCSLYPVVEIFLFRPKQGTDKASFSSMEPCHLSWGSNEQRKLWPNRSALIHNSAKDSAWKTLTKSNQRGYNEAALLWSEVIVANPGTQCISGDSSLEQNVKKGLLSA